MTLQDIIRAVNSLVDDSLPNSDILDWVNFAINDLGVATKADFPNLAIGDMSIEPVIPAQYHELIVLYAAARAKEQDSSTGEADRFMAQYEAKKSIFASEYTVPAEYAKPDPDEDVLNEGYLSTLQNPYGWGW